MAQKISELRAELEGLQEAYSEALNDITKVYDTADREHDDHHNGAFRNCDNPVCKLANELHLAWSEAMA